jgi:diguanylate cyclase (GGDEF)-like protein/putative nucleotidyltransferase with HDIG domain
VRETDSPGGRAAMARAAAAFLAAGGLFGLLSLALPDTVVGDEALLLIVSLASIALALVVIAAGERTPPAGFQVAVAAGTAAASLAVYAWGSGSSYAPLPYAFVVVFAFYFFTLPAAFVHLSLASIGYALALLAESPPGNHFDGWFATTGTLLAGGMFVLAGRERLTGVIANLAHAADCDQLTGLLNRHGFEEAFDVELERARRGQAGLSLIVGDVDRLERVNDERGRAAGDAALRRVACAIGDAKRSFDSAARIGGEEFALLAPTADEHGAYMLAERIREEVEAGDEGPTVSFGIATFPLHGQSAEALLRAADQALYAAKRLGRNRTVISSAEVPGVLARAARNHEEAHVELAALLSLAEALDVRDSGSATHCHRVGRFAELAARELGLTPDAVERVRLAGILHDVGRVGIPDALVRKAGPLTEAEWSLVRSHPEIGARMVETTEFEDIGTWILLHHERPDGHGYPEGPAWAEVPLEARILAVADAYEAMTSERPYRAALAPEDAARELRAAAGRQFDARVVEALLRAV